MWMEGRAFEVRPTGSNTVGHRLRRRFPTSGPRNFKKKKKRKKKKKKRKEKKRKKSPMPTCKPYHRGGLPALACWTHKHD